MSPSLKGKVAIVTGASKGIGAAIAERLAAEGASVVVNYSSSKEGADRVVADIAKKGGRAVAVRANVADEADIDRLFEESLRAFGRLDILVNNAGIFEFVPLPEITSQHFHRHFDVNVLGLLLASQEAIKCFDATGGSIINISSMAGLVPFAGSAVYSATKGAVDAITRVLSVELGPKKIRVNSVNPGMIETEGVKAMGLKDSDMEKAMLARTPLGRIGQPEDVAGVVAFLASDDARWVTGESVRTAGGWV